MNVLRTQTPAAHTIIRWITQIGNCLLMIINSLQPHGPAQGIIMWSKKGRDHKFFAPSANQMLCMSSVSMMIIERSCEFVIYTLTHKINKNGDYEIKHLCCPERSRFCTTCICTAIWDRMMRGGLFMNQQVEIKSGATPVVSDWQFSSSRDSITDLNPVHDVEAGTQKALLSLGAWSTEKTETE